MADTPSFAVSLESLFWKASSELKNHWAKRTQALGFMLASEQNAEAHWTEIDGSRVRVVPDPYLAAARKEEN